MKMIPTHLTEGHQRFKANRYQKEKALFTELAAGQHPTTMVITCADSRVYATEIFDAKPGDLFVVRNVGGLVPPFHGVGAYRSTAAALEFAVNVLEVKYIIVLGHQHCGGIQACSTPHSHEGTHIGAWVKPFIDSSITNPAELEKQTVRRSLKNLDTYDFIKKKLATNSLQVFGGWVSLPEADIEWL